MGARADLQSIYNPAMVANGNGQLAAGGSTTTSSETVTLAAAVPSWVVANMPVYNVTQAGLVGKVGSVSGSTVTLAANATTAIANGDILQFGFTPSDLAVGYAGGADVRGLVDIAVLRCSEAIALLNYVCTDLITNSQDSVAYTQLQAAITALS